MLELLFSIIVHLYVETPQLNTMTSNVCSPNLFECSFTVGLTYYWVVYTDALSNEEVLSLNECVA